MNNNNETFDPVAFDRIDKLLKEAQDRLKTSEISQIIDSFARLYQNAIDRDQLGVIPTERTKKILPLLDDALEMFLGSSFPKK